MKIRKMVLKGIGFFILAGVFGVGTTFVVSVYVPGILRPSVNSQAVADDANSQQVPGPPSAPNEQGSNGGTVSNVQSTDSATNSANQADIPPQGNDVLDDLEGTTWVANPAQNNITLAFLANHKAQEVNIDEQRNHVISCTASGSESFRCLAYEGKLRDSGTTKVYYDCNYANGIMTGKIDQDFFNDGGKLVRSNTIYGMFFNFTKIN